MAPASTPTIRTRVHHMLLRIFGALPFLVRRWIIRAISPNFTVGAMCLIERSDGSVLLVRQSYRRAWGIPGGLLKRGEDMDVGARREVAEEVGLDIELVGVPTVVVDATPQRVDVVYRARLAAADSGPESDSADDVRSHSPEITEVAWFPRHELPELQAETVTAIMALDRQADTAGGLAGDVSRPRRWPSRSAL